MVTIQTKQHNNVELVPCGGCWRWVLYIMWKETLLNFQVKIDVLNKKIASNHDQCAECSNMQQIACTWEK